MSRGAKRGATAVGAALVLAVALYALSRGDGAGPVEPVASGEPASEVVVSVPAPPEPEALDTAALEAAFLALPAPERLAEVAARDYRVRARFPPWSRPLPDAVDPLRRDRAVVPGRSLPRDHWPVLEIAPDRSTYEAPAAVRIRARLRGADGPLAPAELTGELRDSQGRPVAALRFEPEGTRDGRWVATLDPATLPGPSLRGAYLVAVRAVGPAGAERAASTGFLYSDPGGALTGRFRDALVEGDLVIEAELDVQRGGRFHLEGTLADASGVPFTWAQTAGHQEPGRRWVPLRFFGLALHERGGEGVYRLASVALTTVDGMPNQKSDLVTDAHVTRYYAAADFRSRPYDDPDLLRAAERLEGR